MAALASSSEQPFSIKSSRSSSAPPTSRSLTRARQEVTPPAVSRVSRVARRDVITAALALALAESPNVFTCFLALHAICRALVRRAGVYRYRHGVFGPSELGQAAYLHLPLYERYARSFAAAQDAIMNASEGSCADTILARRDAGDDAALVELSEGSEDGEQDTGFDWHQPSSHTSTTLLSSRVGEMENIELEAFQLCFEAAVASLDHFTETRALGSAEFGWAVIGLSLGYKERMSDVMDDRMVRLMEGLNALSPLSRPASTRPSKGADSPKPGERRARRRLHVVGTLLLNEIRARMANMRWLYVVAVVEAWANRSEFAGEIRGEVVCNAVQIIRMGNRPTKAQGVERSE